MGGAAHQAVNVVGFTHHGCERKELKPPNTLGGPSTKPLAQNLEPRALNPKPGALRPEPLALNPRRTLQ